MADTVTSKNRFTYLCENEGYVRRVGETTVEVVLTINRQHFPRLFKRPQFEKVGVCFEGAKFVLRIYREPDGSTQSEIARHPKPVDVPSSLDLAHFSFRKTKSCASKPKSDR
jgi:hypothetical protein